MNVMTADTIADLFLLDDKIAGIHAPYKQILKTPGDFPINKNRIRIFPFFSHPVNLMDLRFILLNRHLFFKMEEPDSVFISDNFNAVEVLNSELIAPPDLIAPIYQNIESFASDLRKQREDEEAKNSGKVLEKKVTTPALQYERKFKPEQCPTKQEETDQLPKKTIFTWIDSIDKGPLTLLKECMKNQFKVKVWTRSAVSIRGFCIGYIVAFDKHWNLALTDVDEFFVRSKKGRSLPIGHFMWNGLVEENLERIFSMRN
ncbi:hypothetical protein QYM36_006737 [Artemia franciscana]|uniref:LSM domain-containing protein n=1 Tax=Artemia franciscana TaxID=6661 RepID=A0AA88L5V2_ARTSF|nr:hypothetical protein QYM36_006737 [Artemia franciscana]